MKDNGKTVLTSSSSRRMSNRFDYKPKTRGSEWLKDTCVWVKGNRCVCKREIAKGLGLVCAYGSKCESYILNDGTLHLSKRNKLMTKEGKIINENKWR